MTKLKSIFLWLISFFYTPVTPTEPQPKENIVKLFLASIITSMLANGAAANTVQVTLTDNADAIQPGAVVNFTADNGATVTPTSALTDANGQITVSLVSSTVGASTLTATAADGTTASIQVYFVAVPAVYTALVETVATGALAEFKAKYEEFAAWLEHGKELLGAAAEEEMVALRKHL